MLKVYLLVWEEMKYGFIRTELTLNLSIKSILFDQCLQQWRSNLGNSHKGRNYNILKDNIALENCFKTLPSNLYWLAASLY